VPNLSSKRLAPGPAQPLCALLLLLALACGGGHHEPESATPKEDPIIPLATTGLAGQPISVIPLTIIIADDSIMETAPFNDRVKSLLWADSIIGNVLLARAPEPKWILPPELRRMAHKAVGLAPDPDHMGQGVMRSPDLGDIPDPLRSSLRTLVALSGGRHAFIPAAVGFSSDSSGEYRADLSLVLTDVRIGNVLWRTHSHALGTTPARALTNAMEEVFPLNMGAR
jgi:hypothetical protein